jgi:hypothetical protein
MHSICFQSVLRVLADTHFSITLSKSTLKSRWICINASDDNLWLFIVGRTYVFNRRSTLNDRSVVALVTGIVNMIHKMVSIEGYSTGFTASSVSQSEVDIWWRGVILQRVRHRATSLLNSSKLHVRSVWYISYNVAIRSFVIFPITRGSRYCA